MSRKLLIGVIGKIGSGKSEIQKILLKRGFESYSMAKPIKDFAVSVGFTRHQAFGSQADKMEINQHYGISCREFLQKFGTDLVRHQLPAVIPEMHSLWLQAAEVHFAQTDASVIIDDIRFPDEAKFVKSQGGYLIEVQRHVTSRGASQHVSETALDQTEADFLIHNDWDLAYLRASVEDILEKLNHV